MADNQKNIYKLYNINNLLKIGKTANDICNILHITRQELYKQLADLKEEAELLKRRYYYTGDIYYSLNKKKTVNEIQNHVPILMKTCKTFDALVISDIHLGSDRERLDLLDRAYNYCIKNNIHVILLAGDLIDGLNLYNRERFNNDYYKLFEYFVKKYPFDKQIITVAVLGNHDLQSLTEDGINFASYLNRYRHDIVPVGCGKGSIGVKKEKIYLYHPLHKHDSPSKMPNGIILRGHSHQALIYDESHAREIKLPSLSDIQIGNSIPSVVRMQCDFEDSYITNFIFQQVVFLNDNKDYEINTLKLKPPYSRNDK